MAARIGVVSDTHGKFDSTLEKLFSSVDLIIHAGDIGGIDIIDRLQLLAPVLAVKGNNDSVDLFPESRLEVIAGRRILIRHIFGELHQIGAAQRDEVRRLQPDVVVFGHSHKPYKERLGGVLLFNPGSAGPRRFALPRTAGILTITGQRVIPKVISLEPKR